MPTKYTKPFKQPTILYHTYMTLSIGTSSSETIRED